MFSKLKHLIKKIKTRLKYGVTCCDVYSFDYYLSKKIWNGLKLFKKLSMSHPINLTEKKWDKILDQMIEGFDLMANDDMWDMDEKKNKKAHKALKLFAEYYTNLWY